MTRKRERDAAIALKLDTKPLPRVCDVWNHSLLPPFGEYSAHAARSHTRTMGAIHTRVVCDVSSLGRPLGFGKRSRKSKVTRPAAWWVTGATKGQNRD